MKMKLFALLFGSALVLSACGGGGDDAAEEPAENNATEQPAENDAAEQPAEDNTAEQPAEGGEAGTEGAVDVAAAEQLYQQSCVSCHGQNLEGGVGPDLTAVGGKYSVEDIHNIIVNGQGAMPPGLLQGEDAEKVAAWLATMK